MNFPTNQVIQFYVIDGSAPTKVTNADGSIQYIITHADGKIETTDKILFPVAPQGAPAPKVVSASDDMAALKSAEISVASGLVVAGQEYIIALTFRGYGLEDTYHKFFSAKAKSTTAADLYVELAKSAWLQRGVENEPLYDLYYVSGGTATKINGKSDITAANLASGFVITEAKPYWQLGSFPEATATIEIGTTPIIVSGVERNDWLVDGNGNPTKFVPGTPSIYNNHKLADLELFAKGERGNSNALANWPDNIKPDLYINPDSSVVAGYDVLTIHYAYVGANQSNQKSERDAIFVQPTGGSALSSILSDVSSLLPIA